MKYILLFLLVFNTGCAIRFESFKEHDLREKAEAFEQNQKRNIEIANDCKKECFPYGPLAFDTNTRNCVCLYKELE